MFFEIYMHISNKIGAAGHVSMPRLYLLSRLLVTRVMLGSKQTDIKDNPAEGENKKVQEVQSL